MKILHNPKNTYAIVFDFDGIFTDNFVYVNENGLEMVRCSRSDGLAIKILKNYIKIHSLALQCCIISKEKNSVVQNRAKKLGIDCYFGVDDKLRFLISLLPSEKYLERVVYLGNDINDYSVMRHVGLSVAPIDAHPLIKKISTQVRPEAGGSNFVRNFIEDFLMIDGMSEDEINELISDS